MIHIRICKRCNKPFDIDTSKELCPECRKGGDKDGLRH